MNEHVHKWLLKCKISNVSRFQTLLKHTHTTSKSSQNIQWKEIHVFLFAFLNEFIFIEIGKFEQFSKGVEKQGKIKHFYFLLVLRQNTQ